MSATDIVRTQTGKATNAIDAMLAESVITPIETNERVKISGLDPVNKVTKSFAITKITDLIRILSEPKYFDSRKANRGELWKFQFTYTGLQTGFQAMDTPCKLIDEQIKESEFAKIYFKTSPRVNHIFFLTKHIASFLNGFEESRKTTSSIEKAREDADIIANGLNAFKTRINELSTYFAKVESGETTVNSERDNLLLNFVNMQQGDCALIKTPLGKKIMIDCGSDGASAPSLTYDLENIKECIESKYFLGNTTTIDHLILTHSDKDHHNKLEYLFGNERKRGLDGFTKINASIKNLIHSGTITDYAKSQEFVSGKAEKIYAVTNRDDYTVLREEEPVRSKNITWDPLEGSFSKDIENHAIVIVDEPDCKISILASNVVFLRGIYDADASTPANRASIVTLIEANGKKILIGGDATKVTEQFLLNRYKNEEEDGLIKDVNLMTAAHHGSETSSHRDYIEETNPLGVVGSAGYGNQHGVPKKTVIRRFRAQDRLTGVTTHDNYYYEDGSSGTEFSSDKTDKHLYITGQNGSQRYVARPDTRPVPHGYIEVP